MKLHITNPVMKIQGQLQLDFNSTIEVADTLNIQGGGVLTGSTTVRLWVVSKGPRGAPSVGSRGTTSGFTAGGTSVSIPGTNLNIVTRVSFGNVPAASFTVNSSPSITATSPAQAAGTVDVTVN